MSNPKHCGHSWIPLSGWTGRYVCEWCHAIGYKKLVTPKYVGHSYHTGHKIVTYICHHTGCDSPAQVTQKVTPSARTRSRFCFEHVRKK